MKVHTFSLSCADIEMGHHFRNWENRHYHSMNSQKKNIKRIKKIRIPTTLLLRTTCMRSYYICSANCVAA